MKQRSHSRGVEIARKLRRTSTEAETLLWQSLRGSRLGVKFRRQHPFGPFVLDFYSSEAKLAVEIDGSQHREDEGMGKDRRRIQYLTASGVMLLRFGNREVFQETKNVLEAILRAVDSRTKSQE